MSSNSSQFGGAVSPQLTSAKPTLIIPEIPTLGTAAASESLAAAAKKRCGAEGCRRKLTPTQLIMGVCKCGACYCDTHRLPEAHTCHVNRRKESDAMLARQLVRVVGDKLERI